MVILEKNIYILLIVCYYINILVYMVVIRKQICVLA
jgi:hypothetical protein